MSKISPDAARRPLYGSPYQLAIPVSTVPIFAGTDGGEGFDDFATERCAQPDVALNAIAQKTAMSAEPA